MPPSNWLCFPLPSEISLRLGLCDLITDLFFFDFYIQLLIIVFRNRRTYVKCRDYRLGFYNIFTEPKCGKHMVYRKTWKSCHKSCGDRNAPRNCKHPKMEGCYCRNGWLLDGDKCVRPKDCGCKSPMGFYLSVSTEELLVNLKLKVCILFANSVVIVLSTRTIVNPKGNWIMCLEGDKRILRSYFKVRLNTFENCCRL